MTLSKGTSLFETNILFGTSEIPSRVFVGYQTQSIFSGNYKKAYFAFERRFHKDGSLNHSEPSQSFSYIEPAIPPESPTVPPESNLTQVHEEAGSVSATIRNLFGRFRRMDQNPDQTINDNENITIEPLPSTDQHIQENIEAFRADDVYIKYVDLKKDGASMMSLSQVEANRQSSPCSYYQFAKGTYDRLSHLLKWKNIISIQT